MTRRAMSALHAGLADSRYGSRALGDRAMDGVGGDGAVARSECRVHHQGSGLHSSTFQLNLSRCGLKTHPKHLVIPPNTAYTPP